MFIMKKGHEKAQTDLNWVYLYLKNGNYPPGLTAIEKRIVRKRAEQFCFKKDELYFLGTVKSKEIGQVPRKVLLTHEAKWQVVQKAHVAPDGTHLGLERTLEPITDKYYWVGIHRFARDYIRQCTTCLVRNPRLGQGGNVSISSASSVTDDDGSSIGDDTLSISGTEVVSTSGDIEYEKNPGFDSETANTFWEKVDLRLYGPFKVSEKNTYILIALDGFSLWPEAFVLDTVSPSTIAQSLMKLICRYGQMGKLVMSQEDIVLETSCLKALELLKEEGFMDIILTKSVVEHTGEVYDEFEDLLEQFVSSHPKTWADCLDFCLLPLRSSCPERADYTPSFLVHSRELQLPAILVLDTSLETGSERGLVEPCMTAGEKKMAVDTLMNIHEAVMRESFPSMGRNDENFVSPITDKSVEKESTPQSANVARVMMTRTRTGSVKPKLFDDESYVTPAKRKASTPAVTPDMKRVKVEVMSTPDIDRTHGVIIKAPEVVETDEKPDEQTTKQPDIEETEEVPSDSEDLPTVAQSGTKVTVDLDHFYKAIKQYLTNQTYLPSSSYNFKKLIRETSKQYKIIGSCLYYISQNNMDFKVIATKEDRLELLEWAHMNVDGYHQSCEAMLKELRDGQVHWKGKSYDCESFALACPDCESQKKKIRVALKNLQEEKKLISYDTCDTYDEIRSFLRKDIYSNKPQSETLVTIKKYLNSFKEEGDQLMYITDMKKKRVITSPAERVKLITEAHIVDGKHLDMKPTLGKVQSGYFWFGMKIDVKVFITYCCNIENGSFLIDRYFMFRAHFMKKGSILPVSRVGVPEVTIQTTQTENISKDPSSSATRLDANARNDIEIDGTEKNNEGNEISSNMAEKPTGIFVSTVASDSEKGPITRNAASKRNIEVTLIQPTDPTAEPTYEVTVVTSEAEPTEKGDMSSVQKHEIGETDRSKAKAVEITVSESEPLPVLQTISVREDDSQQKDRTKISESETKNVVVEINDRGDTIEAKLQTVLKSVQSQDSVPVSDSDPVTMAAVKSILPDDVGAVANVLNEVEVGGDETSPSKVTETAVEMRDNSVNTSVDLVMNDSDLLDEETDSDDEDDDDDDDEGVHTVEVPSTNIHSELLSHLTDSITPTPGPDDEQKKVVKPRQYYKCNICSRVFYGPNKFKTHIYRHTGQKPFACSMCNKKYTNNKSLVIHERAHTGELPYLCNTCGKRMVSKVSLKSHMKIHDGKGGGMPCKCDICGREFTRRHLMERHRTFKHINLQTEFKCSECPKVFGHQRSLKRHFMSHHMGIKNHTCELCGKAFYRKEYLTSHMVQHAGYSLEVAKKKRSPRSYKPHTYVKMEEENLEEEAETREEEEPVRRIILHQDEHGTLRVVDMATEREVKKMLGNQIVQRSEVGETMVVQLEQPSSPAERQVIQIEPGSKIEQRVIEIKPQGGEVEETVVAVENSEVTQEQVVEVPVEGESYIEYQPLEVTVGGQTPLPSSYGYAYTNSQADIAVQANQELIYGQPAVQYEVECVGDVGEDEALSAINLLAQASAAQYENVVVSQI